MQLEKVNKTIKMFRDYVIKESKDNLNRSKHNNTKGLYNSIKGDIVTEDKYTIVGFSMDNYGMFVDKGVKGADPSKVSKNAKITGQQAPDSPFSFKSKRPPSKFLEDWAKKKNIRLRDEKGRFKQGSYKTIGMIIAKNIWARGIKPSLFFTKPFEAGYKKYIDVDLIKAFGQDIDTIIDFNLKDIK
tara:strand:+ start:829 stop:1386 length:558 start_codon:yes stop_codon:yes gene_type:complete